MYSQAPADPAEYAEFAWKVSARSAFFPVEILLEAPAVDALRALFIRQVKDFASSMVDANGMVQDKHTMLWVSATA